MKWVAMIRDGNKKVRGGGGGHLERRGGWNLILGTWPKIWLRRGEIIINKSNRKNRTKIHNNRQKIIWKNLLKVEGITDGLNGLLSILLDFFTDINKNDRYVRTASVFYFLYTSPITHFCLLVLFTAFSPSEVYIQQWKYLLTYLFILSKMSD